MNVYEINLNHPNVPYQRIMVEAPRESAALKIYLNQVARIRKLNAAEALKLAKEEVPMLSGNESQ